MTGPAPLGPARFWRWVQLVVALGLLAVLWRVVDGPAALQSLAAADWRWLVAAFAVLSLQTVLSALRWRLTAARLGLVIGTTEAIREYYAAQLVNQSLPGGVLGDAGRAVRGRAQAGLLVSGQAVVFERLAGQIAMFSTLALGFAVTWALPGGLDWPGWLVGPVAACLALGGAVPLALSRATRLPGAVGRAAASNWAALVRALAGPGALPGQIALGIATTACNLVAFALCARAVGVALDPGAVLALVPLILFAMVIPISVAGWGLREGAAASLLPLAGVAAPDALAASVAFGLAFAAATLPGVLFLWLLPRTPALKT